MYGMEFRSKLIIIRENCFGSIISPCFLLALFRSVLVLLSARVSSWRYSDLFWFYYQPVFPLGVIPICFDSIISPCFLLALFRSLSSRIATKTDDLFLYLIYTFNNIMVSQGKK